MLEIFALCSCACLACLWCAVILELTKEKGSGKGLGNAFGRNCSTCSKDRRCTDCKRQFSRKSCNKNTRANNSYHKKHKMRDRVEIRGKDEEKRSCRCCHCSSPIVTSPEPPFTRSRSFPRLRPNRRAITVCKRACKICRRVKHGCAYARDNNFMHENPSSWHLCGHHSSCPNLTAQGQRGTDRRSPKGTMTLLPPTVEQQQLINEEIPPDPEMRKRDIKAIREWLSKQSHLPNHMDDDRLGNFLFGCKNSIERCKLILERYFSVRTALPELFAVRDPLAQDVQDCCDAIQYFVLPSLSGEGHRVTILRLCDTNIERFSVQAIARRILMVLDLRLIEEPCLSNVMVIDLEGFTAAHFAKCSPTQTIIRRAMLAIQDSMPMRLHRVHFLHAPSVINNILNIFFPLLKEKLVNKFRVHTGGGEELYPYMDKDILPNEWGGTAGTLAELNDAWRKKIERNRDWYLKEEKLSRSNENARLPDMKPSGLFSELDGVQGSFRKLNID
ncbi:hypothetical protein KPH14_001143 [Odynerus spinipes]|uniref:CRAL-TRIO domain-containing protein n=1 Tax=Odynerus spinipes TaxID=1348599 RepID=A0AAD9RQ79_9HYME|nr:hypothetical protein KPH14_001143 [Odynerus spinipes]